MLKIRSIVEEIFGWEETRTNNDKRSRNQIIHIGQSRKIDGAKNSKPEDLRVIRCKEHRCCILSLVCTEERPK